MTAYILVAIILGSLSLVESDRDDSRLPGKFACGILILFGGLRFETGYDWIEYETYFSIVSPLFSNEPQYYEANLLVEPGFALINVIFKTLRLPFQSLLFFITFLNMIMIYIFAKRYTNRIALVLLIYFGFIFLPGQMAAIRQTLSYSLLLLAFLRLDEGKSKTSLLIAAAAISIHTFTALFVPLLFIKPKRLPMVVVVGFFTIGVVTAFAGFNIVPLAAEVLLTVMGGGLLATKLSIYGDYDTLAISFVSLTFIPFHLLIYFLLTTSRYHRVSADTRIIYFATTCTLFSLFTHSYFGVFPAFWNRVSYLTFLLQAIALAARYRAYLQDQDLVFTVTGLSGAASVSIIIYTLSAPTSLPFVPYQNIAYAYVTDDWGDGRWRYAYAFQQAQREMSSRRR